ncbi:MAG TPA: peptidylprolyl isomerase [Flavobacterium sp.]|jgi:peptidylprolyl isomerase
MNKFFLLLAVAATLFSCEDKHADLPDGLYADIETTKGNIVVELAFEKTPVTVANFVTLAEGENKFVREELKGRPFYDGLKWHRVIPNFMIQGGDPDGTGAGDTGYKFKDEITDLQHNDGGVLSMANSGPGTNSSQFFITHVATPWLDGLHTVFGHVVGNGMETVNAIMQDDAILSVKIIRKGEAAKKFNAVKIFDEYFAKAAENLEKKAATDVENKIIYEAKYKAILDKKAAELTDLKATSTKSSTGLQYKIIQKGNGSKPAPGTVINIMYAGFLESGELFDSNVEAVATTFGKFEQARADGGGYRPIQFTYGDKDGMIPGFIEGLEKMSFGDKAILFIPSYLGYGAQGAGGVIPPNANIIFEIEILEK